MDDYKKVELHLHLDGSLRPETIKDLGVKAGLFSDDIALEKIIPLIKISKPGNLKDYLKAFDLPVKILQTEEALERVAFELTEDLYNEGTVYAEIRVAPVQHLDNNLSPEEVVASILRGFNRGQNLYPIKVNLLLCAMRHLKEQDNLFLIDLYNKFSSSGVVGLDLAGNEADFPVTNFKNLFSEALKKNIPFTIHAGEADGPESVLNAIRLGASRIGHGVESIKDLELLEIIKEKNIHLELCPVSNRDTGAVTDFNKYPLLDFLNYGISVSLNSDNRTVSDTNYINEVSFIGNYLDITDNVIKKLNINGINAAFISDKEKKYLRELL